MNIGDVLKSNGYRVVEDTSGLRVKCTLVDCWDDPAVITKGDTVTVNPAMHPFPAGAYRKMMEQLRGATIDGILVDVTLPTAEEEMLKSIIALQPKIGVEEHDVLLNDLYDPRTKVRRLHDAWVATNDEAVSAELKDYVNRGYGRDEAYTMGKEDSDVKAPPAPPMSAQDAAAKRAGEAIIEAESKK